MKGIIRAKVSVDFFLQAAEMAWVTAIYIDPQDERRTIAFFQPNSFLSSLRN